MPKRLAVEHVGNKTIISAVDVTYATPAKSSTKKPAKPKKSAPACTDKYNGVPHKAMPWGSDPRFAVCANCGKHLSRDAAGVYR